MHAWCAVRCTRRSELVLVYMCNCAHEAARRIDADRRCYASRSNRAALNERGSKRNGAVAAHGRVPLVVHEEHADLRLVVIWRHKDAAVHVGMAAWLPHQQLAKVIVLLQCRATPLENRGASELRIAAHHNTKWFTGRVIVKHLNRVARCGGWGVKFQAWHWSTHRASSVPTFFFSARSSSSSAYAKSHAEMPR